MKNGEVVVRRDGKTFSLDMQSLTPAERTAALAWKPSIVQVQDGVATTDSDIDIKITVEPVSAPPAEAGSATRVAAKVILQNKETLVNFKGLKGTLILLGEQPIPRTRVKVLAIQTFSADAAAGGQYDFAGPATDDSSPSQLPNLPAFQYKGYVFVLQGADNNIIQFRRSGPFLRSGQQALKLKVGSIFSPQRPLGNNSRRPATSAKPANAG